MSAPSHPVVQINGPDSEEHFRDALILGLSRTAARIGRDKLAERSRRTRRALDKLFSGDSKDTSGKGLLDFLRADPCALDEVFALYGLHPPRLRSTEIANDMVTMTKVSGLMQQFCEALEDGVRDHNETIELADTIRMLLPFLTQIINEANHIRGLS